MGVDENDIFTSKIFKHNHPKILTNIFKFFLQSHSIVRKTLLTYESIPTQQNNTLVTTTNKDHQRGHSAIVTFIKHR